MNEQLSWSIQTDDLQIGTILSFDLKDSSGQILHPAGVPIHEQFKIQLQRARIQSVRIQGASQYGEDQTDLLLGDSYPKGRVSAIQASLQTTQLAVRNFAAAVQKRQIADVEEVKENVIQLIGQASQNISAALAVVAMQAQVHDGDLLERMTKRSTSLALLGVATSLGNEDDPKHSMEIGLAGLLHDCSLFLHPEWFSSKRHYPDHLLEEYQRHPIESAEIVNRAKGIPKNVITLINQVHEQADGTGYPRGMKLRFTYPGASILNLADAYLTLVEPVQGIGLVPSDALSYLCYHAAQGKFCSHSLQQMIRSMSIYPVGSPVLLDDDSKALVVEGNPEAPLQPVVRLLQLGNLRIDLGNSIRSIREPFSATGVAKFTRIKKAQMQEILWRTDR